MSLGALWCILIKNVYIRINNTCFKVYGLGLRVQQGLTVMFSNVYHKQLSHPPPIPIASFRHSFGVHAILLRLHNSKQRCFANAFYLLGRIRLLTSSLTFLFSWWWLFEWYEISKKINPAEKFT